MTQCFTFAAKFDFSQTEGKNNKNFSDDPMPNKTSRCWVAIAGSRRIFGDEHFTFATFIQVTGEIMQSQITEWGSALMTSLAAAMTLLFSGIPKIFGFAVIVIIGWFLATLAQKAVAAILRTIKFNDLAMRSGFSGFVQKMGAETDAAEMIGAVVKWFIRLMALVVAFDALGLPAVSDILRQLLLWLPNVAVALAVLVIAGLAANALSSIVRGAAAEGGLTNPELLAKLAAGLIWGFGIVVAVSQIGVATILVNTLFMAVVGALALALGLAFGLGGRDTASQIVRNWYGQSQQNSENLRRTAHAISERTTGAVSNEGLVQHASGSVPEERRTMQRRGS